MPQINGRTADISIRAIINACWPGLVGYCTANITNANSTYVANDGITFTDPSGAASFWTYQATVTAANGLQIGGNPSLPGVQNMPYAMAAMLGQLAGVGTAYGSGTPPSNLFVPNIQNPGVGGIYLSWNTLKVQSNIPGAVGNFSMYFTSAGGSGITLSGITNAYDWPTNTPWAAMFPTPVLDTGTQIMPYVGHNWNLGTTNGPNALSMIEDCVRSENGQFYQQNDGTLVFRNRQWYWKQIANTVAFTSTGNELADGFSGATDVADIISSASVLVTPKSVQASGTLSKNSQPVKLPPGNTTVHLSLIDPVSLQPCGVSQLTLPLVPSTDYTLNTQSNGSGTDYTTAYVVSLFYQVNGTQLDVTFNNTSGTTLYCIGLQVRGTGLVQKQPQLFTATSAGLLFTNDVRIDATFSTDVEFAQNWANLLIKRYGQNTPWFRGSKVDFGAIASVSGVALSSLTIGNTIQINNSQTQETGTYLVLGRSLHTEAAGVVKVALVIEKLDDLTLWNLGNATYGALGGTTRLGI
jgi:hypothetical protein